MMLKQTYHCMLVQKLNSSLNQQFHNDFLLQTFLVGKHLMREDDKEADSHKQRSKSRHLKQGRKRGQ